MNLFSCSTLFTLPDSLKMIDPLDSIGDGTGRPLSVGDRAVVADALGAIAFYVLKEGVGVVDSGFMVVVPAKNPGSFYWACCGRSRNKVSAISGDRFLFLGGSKVPPAGFIGGSVPYSLMSLQIYDTPGTTNYSWSGTGVIGGMMYVVYPGTLCIWNLSTGEYTEETISNTEKMWYTPGHCTLDAGSSNYIVDFCGDSLTLKRFDVIAKEASTVPFQFTGGYSSWEDIIGYDGYPWFAIKVGNYFYGWWGNDAATAIGVKVDVITGVVTRIADAPGFVDGGVCIPDLYSLHIYFISENSNSVYKYDICSDSWETFPNFPGEIWWWWCGHFDTKTNSLIVPSFYSDVFILDIEARVWSRHKLSVPGDMLYGSVPLYYKGVGTIWAFGLNKGSDYFHGLISEDNPYYIEKI
jgi:hypothetical protein